MHYGSPIPITAFPEFDAVKDYVQTLEGEGFDFTSTSGHVLAQDGDAEERRRDGDVELGGRLQVDDGLEPGWSGNEHREPENC